MSPFAPKGSRSHRVIVTELAAEAKAGDILTFTQLAEALGVDEGDRSQVRQAVSAARQTLLTRHHRALVAIRGTGYRVALPGEFAGLAEGHKDRASNQIAKALAVVENAPESEMSPAELKRHRAVSLVMRNLNNRLTSVESRLADLEEAIFGPEPVVIQGRAEEPS